MRNDVNRSAHTGHLGRKPELKTTQSGNQYARLSIACNYIYFDAQKKAQSAVDWISYVAWNKLAEVVTNHLDKGSQIYVEGRVKPRTYEDKNKTKHYPTDLVLTRVLFLDKKNDQVQAEAGPEDVPAPVGDEIPNDDIPF